MDTLGQSYGDLIRLSPDGDSRAETVPRIPLGTTAARGGMDESTLRDLLFQFPESLPIALIDASYSDAVPICRELATPAGYVDALFVNSHGRMTLAEFKLWRNPQARREVIGQILDYAQALARWSYEDLQREVSRALGKKGNVLFELIRENAQDANEAEFVDNVARHLKRGEFLLLIVGDGIREGVENIVSFVQQHSGLHFNLALVEAAVFRDADSRLLVQPRVLSRTEVVRRVVFDADAVVEPEEDQEDVLSDDQRENLRFWKAVLDAYSFSDVTVEIPAATKDAALFVRVRDSGFNGWGLSFVGYLFRRSPHVGCYLSCRKDIPQAVRVFERIAGSLQEVQGELGDGLDHWTNRAGRPRIGFKRQVRFPLVSDSGGLDDLGAAVEWMRVHLDRLVTVLHPRLQALLSDES